MKGDIILNQITVMLFTFQSTESLVMTKEEEHDDDVYVCLDTYNQDDHVECFEYNSVTTGLLQNDRMKFMDTDMMQCDQSEIT